MSRRMWVLAVGAWVVVVIAGSLLTWLAIDRAGQQVTGSAAATQAPVVGTVGPPPSTPTTPAPTSAGTPKAPASPGASPSAPGTPAGTPAPGRATTGHTSPSPATTTKRPATSPPKASAPAPRTETRTWSGAPGFVTVSCTGTRATRTGASPSDGWSLEAGDASGDSVEVTFRNGETEVQVKATCSGGVPQFHVESGGGGDDG